jgi:hypothetical protein
MFRHFPSLGFDYSPNRHQDQPFFLVVGHARDRTLAYARTLKDESLVNSCWQRFRARGVEADRRSKHAKPDRETTDKNLPRSELRPPSFTGRKMRTRINEESIVAIELHHEEAKALYDNLADRDNWMARLLLENIHQQEELIRKRAKTAIFRRLGKSFYYVLVVGVFGFIIASGAWQKPFNEWKDILFPKHEIADTTEGPGAPRYGSLPYQKKGTAPEITLYYPVARGTVSNATMWSTLTGRSLHWLTPAERAIIIKSWQSENPSLTLKPGSYQNPFWIGPVTSFSGDYQAQIEKLPDYSWYNLNWFTYQKLPKH